MVIVPKEILEKLAKGVSEEDSGKNGRLPFDFDDFIKTVDNESKINTYLARRNISFVGTGTSRTAYLIPKGSCTDAKNVPVCFKVAKNLVGIKQNETEREIIGRYGKEEPCFVKIYRYDDKRNLCLESEIGSPIEKYDMKKYFADWNSFMEKEASAHGSFFSSLKQIFSKIFKDGEQHSLASIKIDSAKNVFDMLFAIKDFRKLGTTHKKYRDTAAKFVDAVAACGKSYPKYAGISSLVNVLFNKGGEEEIRIGEFNGTENFAMVYRGGSEPVMIPIDYGITEKVFANFYGKAAKTDYFRSLK